jgi:Protein of unknown function (DUF1302)
MRRMTTFSGWWWALVLILELAQLGTAGAIYLDEEQKVSLRLRAYTRGSIRIQDSRGDTTPNTKAGQLIQHRNFFNPELEAKLVSYTTWMKNAGMGFMAPDALDFRLAAWGFYDGIYDYGTGQFKDQLSRTKAQFFEATSADDVLLGTADADDARTIFGNQERINELYLSYSKGPVFLRVGRQAISWGESDTIALLDQNNPFDLTQAAPGLFEDVDEARIPLWTVRGSYALFDTLGPLSSGFVEAYWVPGDIDVTTSTVPPPTWSPYSAPGQDPQSNPLLLILNKPQFALVDHLPSTKMSNSRWGARVQAVVARDYTVSAWFYKSFNQAPVPRIDSVAVPNRNSPACVPGNGINGCQPILATELIHQLVPVVGVSNTFFFQPLNGIIRMEAEYFNREPAFIPQVNLLIPQVNSNPTLLTTACQNPQTGRPMQCVGKFAVAGTVPHADFLRWELGYDRFFFFRPLNPTNSFVFVTAVVGSYNMNETSKRDYYYDGQFKPGKPPTSGPNVRNPIPSDFVQLEKVEVFAQAHLQTDYLHGRLTPGLTVIGHDRGTYAVNPTVTYRWSDSLLFDLNFIYIGGAFQGLGFFRDRGQISMRATYQLN